MQQVGCAFCRTLISPARRRSTCSSFLAGSARANSSMIVLRVERGLRVHVDCPGQDTLSQRSPWNEADSKVLARLKHSVVLTLLSMSEYSVWMAATGSAPRGMSDAPRQHITFALFAAAIVRGPFIRAVAPQSADASIAGEAPPSTD
jgi:hypothetical protein